MKKLIHISTNSVLHLDQVGARPPVISGSLAGSVATFENLVATAVLGKNDSVDIKIFQIENFSTEKSWTIKTGLIDQKDSHFYLDLIFNGRNEIHVAGWCHSSQMYIDCFRLEANQWKSTKNYNSPDKPESRLSYPMFFFFQDRLYLSARSGAPGSGDQLFWEFDRSTDSWKRSRFILEGRSVASPYIGRPLLGAFEGTERLSLSIAWRLGVHSYSNFRLTHLAVPELSGPFDQEKSWQDGVSAPIYLGDGLLNGSHHHVSLCSSELTTAIVVENGLYVLRIYNSKKGRWLNYFELVLDSSVPQEVLGTLDPKVSLSVPEVINEDTFIQVVRDGLTYRLLRVTSNSATIDFEIDLLSVFEDEDDVSIYLVGERLIIDKADQNGLSFRQAYWKGPSFVEDHKETTRNLETLKAEIGLLQFTFQWGEEGPSKIQKPKRKDFSEAELRKGEQVNNVLNLLLERLSENVHARIRSQKLLKSESIEKDLMTKTVGELNEEISALELKLRHAIANSQNLELTLRRRDK